jgi:hypothetical protein
LKENLAYQFDQTLETSKLRLELCGGFGLVNGPQTSSYRATLPSISVANIDLFIHLGK